MIRSCQFERTPFRLACIHCHIGYRAVVWLTDGKSKHFTQGGAIPDCEVLNGGLRLAKHPERYPATIPASRTSNVAKPVMVASAHPNPGDSSCRLREVRNVDEGNLRIHGEIHRQRLGFRASVQLAVNPQLGHDDVAHRSQNLLNVGATALNSRMR